MIVCNAVTCVRHKNEKLSSSKHLTLYEIFSIPCFPNITRFAFKIFHKRTYCRAFCEPVDSLAKRKINITSIKGISKWRYCYKIFFC